jgi:hypothetical protein
VEIIELSIAPREPERSMNGENFMQISNSSAAPWWFAR